MKPLENDQVTSQMKVTLDLGGHPVECTILVVVLEVSWPIFSKQLINPHGWA